MDPLPPLPRRHHPNVGITEHFLLLIEAVEALAAPTIYAPHVSPGTLPTYKTPQEKPVQPVLLAEMTNGTTRPKGGKAT